MFERADISSNIDIIIMLKTYIILVAIIVLSVLFSLGILLIKKPKKILSKMSEIKNINLKYDKYWNILYILTKTLEDNHLLDKTISAFEKDLKYLDIFSINMILEMIHDNKKIWKNFKKKLKEVIQNNDISKNEIISKEHNKLNGTQFLTEDEVIKKYREILSKLQS